MTNALDLIDDWGPEKIVVVSHRRTGMKGVLVIDNTARGMGKGGTRMAPTVSVTEIARLARNMTWKWAGVDLFYGGAKAGIAADPAAPDKEAILRAFARALSNEVPREYVLGLDMGLTEDDAAIVQDELGDRGAAVGTPAHLGGVAYDQLGVTGYGVAEAADAAALTEARAEHGDHFVTRIGPSTLPAGAELTVDCDVLVPAALQDVIDEATAHQVKARLVVEGANLPTSPAAQTILAERDSLTPHQSGRRLAEDRVLAAMRCKGQVAT
jgi:glutamate dehydrogenase (NAD(P)+)